MGEDKSVAKVEKISNDKKWAIYSVGDGDDTQYFLVTKKDGKLAHVNSPKGEWVRTQYKQLADRILEDLEEYGDEEFEPESILPWHCTLIDNFINMSHSEIELILNDSFLKKNDWTYGIESDWKDLFGEEATRVEEIRKWLKECTYMQMTAACCIGNAYFSLNLSYVLALMMENFHGEELQDNFGKLAQLVEENVPYGMYDEIMEMFGNFELYYGIHLEELGPIINKTITIEKENDEAFTDEDFAEEIIIDEDFEEEAPDTQEEKFGYGWTLIAGEENRPDGIDIMRELDEEGFIEATLTLALFETDTEKREELIKKAADKDNSEGLWQYCGCIPHSYCPDPHNTKDALWEVYCRRAAELGSVDAMNEMGNIFHRREHYTESMYWYILANACGQPDGGYSIAGIAEDWKNAGCPRDFIPGSPGFDESRHKCALAYLDIHTHQQPAISPDEMNQYIDDGVEIAALLLGDISEATEQYETALNAYKKLADKDDAHCCKCYADMLMIGKGIESDPKEAAAYYKRAEEGGEREAMFVAAQFAALEKKSNMAGYWYGKAINRGYEIATEGLLKIKLTL
ncbi:MAG: hypothetical protein MJ092_03505 [Lachnospiraceae bacterium]|nr:hypothetical protein [Lachnospiraceae bacterium]